MRLLPAMLVAALTCAAPARVGAAQAQVTAAADPSTRLTAEPAIPEPMVAEPIVAKPVSASDGPLRAPPAPLSGTAAAAPGAPQPPAPHTRMTWEQRFAQANTSHDGHLTAEQANAGYKTIARHFHEIDADAKGYVTEDDVRAWHKTQRTAHRPPAPESRSLQPQHAFQRTFAPTLQINTATDRTVLQPATPFLEPQATQAGSDAPAPTE